MSHNRIVPLLLLYTNVLQLLGWNSAAVITSVSSSILAGLISTISTQHFIKESPLRKEQITKIKYFFLTTLYSYTGKPRNVKMCFVFFLFIERPHQLYSLGWPVTPCLLASVCIMLRPLNSTYHTQAVTNL